MPKPTISKNLELSRFFAVSKQNSIVYSAASQRSEKIHSSTIVCLFYFISLFSPSIKDLLRADFETDDIQYDQAHDKTNKIAWAPSEDRSAWTSAQFDQSLRCPHEKSLGPQLPIECTAKTLIRLCGYAD